MSGTIFSLLAMNASEALRGELLDNTLERLSRRDKFHSLLDVLRRIDPSWERWYDESVPEWSDWLNAPLALLDARIHEILQEGECTCKPDAAQDCPVCRSRRECA